MDAYYQYNNGKAAYVDNGKQAGSSLKFKWGRFLKGWTTVDFRHA